ncbi:Fe-S oxidoreductase [Halobacteriales archaeon QH_7_69_31]|nr:MAG: Fe-S oxidoreductase [Halobacteriales archaeon QH_7_69_31]
MPSALALQAGGDLARETYWQIGPVQKVLFYFLATLTILVAAIGVYRRFARYTRGTADWFDRLDDLPGRIASAAKIVATNETQFNRDLVGGLMHAFIMWGFLTLLIATTILFVDIDFYQVATGDSFWVGDFYLSYQLVTDALGLLFVVGLAVALWRRYVRRSDRLWGKHTDWEDAFLVWSLFLLGLGGFLLEGLRILGQGPESVSFVGTAVALALASLGLDASSAAAVYPLAWWSHALLAFLFIAAIPYAKPFHMISSFANVVTRDEQAGVRLPGVPSDLDATNAESIDDFSWRELLDQDACTKCGRCSAVCPAKASGRPLDPRDVILDLKAYRQSVEAGGETKPIIADGGGVIDTETMESCMACMACMDACPVEIEHLKSFTRLNRQQVDQGDVRPEIQDVFQNVMQKGNTFGDPPSDRGDWTEELGFEVADAREESVSVGILYEDEVYDGNDVRRIGEEFLFVEQAGTLVDSFRECDYGTIVCTDPHSYNTFKNEYPEVDFEAFADDPMMEFAVEGYWNRDGDVEVYHWTQAVEELVGVDALGLGGDELDYTVTYHDPCHLGRFNDEYEAPRELVRATGCDLREMPRNRANSFCCGGGGGGLWMDFDEEPKPSEERLREALEDTDAGAAVEKFVVACPMCMTMYEDGRKTGGFEEDIEIVDVAELVVEALEVNGAPVATAGDAGTDAAPADD